MPLPCVLRRSRNLLCLVLLLVALGFAATPARAEGRPEGVWPLDPRPQVIRGFDPPSVVWEPGHRGVDLLGHLGQRVRAALPGTVTFAGTLAGRGVVVVSHGPTRTTYEPVTAEVAVGTSVGRGDTLGTLAWFGSHCLPRSCLHWGWLRGDAYLDPLDLVGAGPVRLLPLWRDGPVTASAPARLVERPVWANPYATVLQRLARTSRSWSVAGQARGCACW